MTEFLSRSDELITEMIKVCALPAQFYENDPS